MSAILLSGDAAGGRGGRGPDAAGGQAGKAKRPRLSREIAVVLVLKAALLTLLWFLFVRNHEVQADARSTAAAMGLQSNPAGPQGPAGAAAGSNDR